MKKKKIAAVILAVMIGITAFSGCGTKENKSPADTSGTGSSVEAQEDTGKEAGGKCDGDGWSGDGHDCMEQYIL
mgnify:CR=1 FL=1